MHALRITPALAAALLTFSACAGRRADPIPDGAPSFLGFVRVHNSNWLRVNVFLVRGGTRIRLGEVEGNGSGFFRIPTIANVDGTIRLLIDPIGSRETYLTENIPMGVGGILDFNVGSTLSMSNYMVRFR